MTSTKVSITINEQLLATAKDITIETAFHSGYIAGYHSAEKIYIKGDKK